MMEKEYIGPALKKWQKNARLLKCHEDARTIQDFCRKNLRKRIKNKAKKEMQILYKKYIYKLIAEMLKTKKINPQDVEKLYHTLKRVAVREPFYKLLEGLRWKIIIKNLKNVPKIYDRNRKEILRKYLERWYTNAIIVPDDMANKIQNSFRAYLSRKKLDNIRIKPI